jgi:hypothetical protein
MRVVELLPFKRRRHRRAGTRPNRIRWRGGLRVGIARRINKDSALTFLLPHFNGQVIRIGIDQLGRNVAREGANLLEVRTPIQWDEHV